MHITLTETAARHIDQYRNRHQALGLRLKVKPSGCSGFGYDISPALEIGDDDVTFEQFGAVVVVDKKSLPFLDGIELDYVREGLNQKLVFNNPNAKDLCGCGESFAI